MYRRLVVGIVTALLIVNIAVFALDIQLVRSEPRTWTVDDDGPADFSTIQQAVYFAGDGDTIFVHSGIYGERQVTIDKRLQLIGENKETTIIDGMESWVCVCIRSIQGTSISGFTMQNGWGLYLWRCQDVTVSGNIFSNNGQSITVLESNGSTILQNVVTLNRDGICLSESNNNSIFENIVTLNEDCDAIRLDYSHSNVIRGNTISNNSLGTSPGYHVYGIHLSRSNSNRIYHNNIANNHEQAKSWDSADNTWDNGYPSGGNYWSDYNDIDLSSGPYQNETGSDGIGDAAYIIDKNDQDNYPLMEAWASISGSLHIVEPANGSTVNGVANVTFSIHNTGGGIKFFEGDSSNRVDLEIEYSLNETHGWGTMVWSTSYHGLALSPGEKYTQTILYDPAKYEDLVPLSFGSKAPYGEATIRLVHWKQVSWRTFDYGEFGVAEVEITLTFREDLSLDGKVDIKDIAITARTFGTYPEHQRWNSQTDINQDAMVDMKDLVLIASNFGKTYL